MTMKSSTNPLSFREIALKAFEESYDRLMEELTRKNEKVMETDTCTDGEKDNKDNNESNMETYDNTYTPFFTSKNVKLKGEAGGSYIKNYAAMKKAQNLEKGKHKSDVIISKLLKASNSKHVDSHTDGKLLLPSPSHSYLTRPTRSARKYLTNDEIAATAIGTCKFNAIDPKKLVTVPLGKNKSKKMKRNEKFAKAISTHVNSVKPTII